MVVFLTQRQRYSIFSCFFPSCYSLGSEFVYWIMYSNHSASKVFGYGKVARNASFGTTNKMTRFSSISSQSCISIGVFHTVDGPEIRLNS